MSSKNGVASHILLKRLQAVLAEASEGQTRLDKIVSLIAESMATEVCSVYLRRDEALELCATQGLDLRAVHETRMALGEGLVGRVAEKREPLITSDAPNTQGFSYRPETAEDRFMGFLGVPIQRLGQLLGVLVVQSEEPRNFNADEVHGVEIVAMVLAEMTELGAFSSNKDNIPIAATTPLMVRGLVGQEGTAIGTVYIHNGAVPITRPVADDPDIEKARLADALSTLADKFDSLRLRETEFDKETSEVLSVFQAFTQDKGWRRRLNEDIDSGLSAEAAIDIEQTRIRNRLERIADSYMRERLNDLDDLSNRLLRILTGANLAAELPHDAVILARTIGPAELLDYGRRISGVVLEEGSVGSHAAIIARAFAIPLVIQAKNILRNTRNGDPILVDGDRGVVHLRPDSTIHQAFREKVAMSHKAQERFASIRDEPAISRDGTRIGMLMNAGLLADLPSLKRSGAEGVGLFRTELQFLARSTVPKRMELADIYSRVLDSAEGTPVTFRTLDIGSDKVLPYMKRIDEPNPALGWRAIRVGLDRKNILKMQLQALLRASKGRPLYIMFPFIAHYSEYKEARAIFDETLADHLFHRHLKPAAIRIGAMLETPSMLFAPDAFFKDVDFISIGGNDLKQFFYAADRENERVRRRYDTLNLCYLDALKMIADRCEQFGTKLSFCGEDAGRPIEALIFAALGINRLSMRPASIGPVKSLIRQIDLSEVAGVIENTRNEGNDSSVRHAIREYLAKQDIIG